MNEPTALDFARPLATRDGRCVRVYGTDGSVPMVVHGAIQNPSGWIIAGWQKNGHFFSDGRTSVADLVQVPARVQRTLYLNLYPLPAFDSVYGTRAEANRNAGPGRLACAEVQVNCVEGTSL